MPDVYPAVLHLPNALGVGSIVVGELLCDSLDEVLDSTLLRFAISSTQTVTAERAYYKVMEGDPLTDNEERKGFFLKMITRQGDGLTDVVTSVPCETGTVQEICLVETTVVYSKSTSRVVQDKPDKNRSTSKGKLRRSLTGNGAADATPAIGKLESKTQIDVLVLYTAEAMAEMMATSASEMETKLKYYFAEANLGNDNSEIPLEYNVVHVTELPYEQQTDGEDALSSITLNAAVSTIRKEVEADLVHLIGLLPDYCGISTIFGDGDSDAYALTSADCVDGLTIGRELGHNMGCDRDRDTLEDEDEEHPYAYGLRYCTGTDPYVTIMSHEENCNGGFINYYSNPDVTYFDKPTGTETENCARRIKETMDTVAKYMEAGGDGCVSTGDPCTITSDCCDMTCVDGVCGVQ
eukprot:jgi/Undpi1/10798/HiC_scaffold_29.g13246.m1